MEGDIGTTRGATPAGCLVLARTVATQREGYMSWFLMRARAQTEDPLMEERILLEGAKAKGPQSLEPALALLAVDARGPACRRIHCFQDAEAAKRFVKFWYPYRSDDSVTGY